MEFLLDILAHPGFRDLMLTTLVALTGYLVRSVKRRNKTLDEIQLREKQTRESIRRSTLRNEYLSIYNSPTLSWTDKYGFTRSILEEYRKLSGNHYIADLDEKMRRHMSNETNQLESTTKE